MKRRVEADADCGSSMSGSVGRELGEWGYDNYLETKQITRYDRSAPWGWYLKGE